MRSWPIADRCRRRADGRLGAVRAQFFAPHARGRRPRSSQPLLTFDINLTGERAAYQARQVQFYEAPCRSGCRACRGVRAVGAAVTLPIGGDNFGTSSHLPEGSRWSSRIGARAGYQVVTPGYLRRWGFRLWRVGMCVTDIRSAARRAGQ